MPPIFLLNLKGDWGFETGKIPTNGFRVREIGDGIDLKVSGFVDSGKFDVNIYLSNGTAIDSLMMQFSGYGDLGYFNENIFIPANQLNSLKNDFKIVLTQNGSTKGGLAGCYVQFTAIASAAYYVSGTLLASGTLVTPFADA